MPRWTRFYRFRVSNPTPSCSLIMNVFLPLRRCTFSSTVYTLETQHTPIIRWPGACLNAQLNALLRPVPSTLSNACFEFVHASMGFRSYQLPGTLQSSQTTFELAWVVDYAYISQRATTVSDACFANIPKMLRL